MNTTLVLRSLWSCTIPLLLTALPLFAEPLWDKAMVAFEKERPLPRLITMEEQFVNAQGKVEHASTVRAELMRNSRNQVVFVPRSGTANGTTIPEKDLTEMIEVLAEKDLHGGVFNRNSKPVATPEQFPRTIADHSCMPFAFTATIEEHQAQGTACLTADSGQPLEVEWRFLDVPFKDDDSTITTYRQTDSYRLDESGESQLEQSEVNIALEYSLLMMSFSGELRRVTRFADYRLKNELSPVPPSLKAGI